MRLYSQILSDLARECGLVHPARPREHLQKAAGILHSLKNCCEQLAFELRLHRSHYDLLTTLSKITHIFCRVNTGI
jgi:hypothetical protein